MPYHADDRPAMMFAEGNSTLWELANLNCFGSHRRSNATAFPETYKSDCVLIMMPVLLDKT